jgi:hypothetical protein
MHAATYVRRRTKHVALIVSRPSVVPKVVGRMISNVAKDGWCDCWRCSPKRLATPTLAVCQPGDRQFTRATSARVDNVNC